MITDKKNKLKECHPLLVELISAAGKQADFLIICGHRGQQEQDQAFAEGKSKLKYPNGKHNKTPSEAVDIAPMPLDWQRIDRFEFLASIVMRIAKEKGIQIRWGGDFNQNGDSKDDRFHDYPHFELISLERI